MRGSFLISYIDDLEFGGDYLNIYSNSILSNRIYNQTKELYTIPLYTGDVINIQYVPIGGFTSDYTLIRRDYTTDDTNSNNGIVDTVISTGTLTSYTFTATTINNAYDFEYILTNNVISNYQIWTESSDPITTENDEFINQQF